MGTPTVESMLKDVIDTTKNLIEAIKLLNKRVARLELDKKEDR